ncbi:MAG: hypothetical protein FJ035_05115 [Chloroflexi bacterium]|nr:hypothetical protein [Chloroflexota bacterium]
MIVLGVIVVVALALLVGFIIVQSAFSHRHWRHVIAEGDTPTLLAAVEEALETFRGLRPPRGMPPADWRALQSAALVAADRDRCRVSVLAEPDIRVVGTARREVGPVEAVARRVVVRMAERLLYEIPLARFEAVQVDVYTQYRSPDGAITTDCLLSTQVSRTRGAETEWDEQEAAAILATWRTRERAPGVTIDPDERAIIMPGEPPAADAGNNEP